MTIAISRALSRALLASIALGSTLAGFAATTQPAFAAGNDTYTVALASPLAAPRREIINGVLWRCEGQSCVAAADGSREVTACRRAAKAFGEVAGFTGPGGPFRPEDVAACNSR